MSDGIFKGVVIVGTSGQSFSHAIEAAVARARKTLHNLSWFVVEEMRGGLQQGRLQYQVTLRVFFKLDDVDEAGMAGEASRDVSGGQAAAKKKRPGAKGRSGRK